MTLDVIHDLRHDLQRLTDDLAGDRRGEQFVAIPAAAAEHGRSIELIAPCDPSGDYVCYQYAFEIEELPRLHTMIRQGDASIRPDRWFISFLIKNYLSEVDCQQVAEQAVAIYDEHAWIKHAGRVSDGRVISKWGEGHLWRHGVLDVPRSYGDSVKFFAPMSRADVLDAFLAYARARRGDAFIDRIIANSEASG